MPNSVVIRKLFDADAFNRASLGSPCSLCLYKDTGKPCDRRLPPCIIGGVEYYFVEVDTGDQSPEGYSLKKWNANN